MKKKAPVIITLLAAAAVLSVGFNAFAAGLTETIEVTYTDASIYVDGYLIETTDAAGEKVEPLIYNGTTYLPLRAVSDALGKTIEWDKEANRIDIGRPDEGEIREITVSTAEEFVAALGSNTRILMKEGVYNLSGVSADNDLKSNVFWKNVYDGNELNLYRIQNLSIEGIGERPSELIVEPRYAYILSFTQCSNISIENVTAGHTEAGECVGGVFSFSDSADIRFNGVNMYGCGTEGLSLYNVTDMTVKNASIYECTYDLMTVNMSKNIRFEDCDFYDTNGFSMVNIYSTNGLVITGCDFRNNESSGHFFNVNLSKGIEVTGCTFDGNTADTLQGDGGIENLLNANTFSGNNFSDE